MTKIKDKLTLEIKEAKALVKTGLFTGYEVEYTTDLDGNPYVIVWLTPRKSFWENEACTLACARESWQKQAHLNKLNPKFCNRLYKLAVTLKAYLNEDIYWEELENYLAKNFPQLVEDIFQYVFIEFEEDSEMNNIIMPSTRDLMYWLDTNIFHKRGN